MSVEKHHGQTPGHRHGQRQGQECPAGHRHRHGQDSAEGNDRTLPLSSADEDRSYRVVEISGGHDVQMRLASLGLLPGKRIHVVQRRGHGPVMITVHAGKLALGRGISHHLHVSPIAEAS